MTLKPTTEAKLKDWVNRFTWHTGHDNDMDRWYIFVDQYAEDHGFQIDEPFLKEHIEALAVSLENPKVFGDELRTEVSNLVSLAYSILDFLKATGRVRPR